MTKLLSHEQKRLREHAALTLNLSPDTKAEVTKKDVTEFTKHLLTTVAQKRHIKHWQVVLIEVDGEKS
ncbi:MAG: hypothetical protein A4E20_03985 [Nitrospira sp. SG-bin2]|jgi:hypothetical protein|uniref:hypothetical protein n=1 Tax=Nitrospira cf. moscoviensis SBR1015 TaxID=96242 RepID=UPI000A0DF6AB|nr:hypothetical protein [Nitrospira cf. moscoviensis SBR1015]OQW31453.1 MAG: hypothetical protein A4E20_03985 [Nitrospira sp. SG-bin2]